MIVLALIILYLILVLPWRWSDLLDDAPIKRRPEPFGDGNADWTLNSEMRRVEPSKPTILYFRSNAELDCVIEDEDIEFEWKVAGADSVCLVCEGTNIDVSTESGCAYRFHRDQSVTLIAVNQAGQKATRKLEIKIIPLPSVDSRIPFPDLSYSVPLQLSSPIIPSIDPPMLGLLGGTRILSALTLTGAANDLLPSIEDQIQSNSDTPKSFML